MSTDHADQAPEQRTLTDDQIRDIVAANDGYFRQALGRTKALVEANAEKDGADEVTLPAETLREMHQAMASMYKTMRDSSLGESEFLGAGGNHGDRGSHCDYNPFNRINMGDGVNS